MEEECLKIEQKSLQMQEVRNDLGLEGEENKWRGDVQVDWEREKALYEPCKKCGQLHDLFT